MQAKRTQKLLRPKLCYHAKLQRELLSGWQAQKLEPRCQNIMVKLIQGQAVKLEGAGEKLASSTQWIFPLFYRFSKASSEPNFRSEPNLGAGLKVG